MRLNVKKLIRAGIVAGLYTALTLLTIPISSGAIQVRVAEAFTLLPLLYPEAIPALCVGCLISNLLTGCTLFDIILGSLITLVSGILTYGVGKIIKKTAMKILIGGFFPVALNAIFLPLIWVIAYGAVEYIYYAQALILFAGQAISVYALGSPLYIALKKYEEKREFFS